MKCENCNFEVQDVMEKMPHITINIKYVDNRLNEDKANYVENLTMLDSEEEE